MSLLRGPGYDFKYLHVLGSCQERLDSSSIREGQTREKAKKKKEEDRRSPTSRWFSHQLFQPDSRVANRVRTRDSGNSLDRVPG